MTDKLYLVIGITCIVQGCIFSTIKEIPEAAYKASIYIGTIITVVMLLYFMGYAEWVSLLC